MSQLTKELFEGIALLLVYAALCYGLSFWLPWWAAGGMGWLLLTLLVEKVT